MIDVAYAASTALLLTPLAAASLARPAHAASPAAEPNARLLALVAPRIKAICEANEFAVRCFTATWSPDGQSISYIQSDVSAVPKRAALVPEGLHPDAPLSLKTIREMNSTDLE